MTTTSTTPATTDHRRALRTGGTAMLIAAAATLLTPITVFMLPWTAIDPGYADPTSWRDPLMTAAVAWIGPIYGVQYLVLATVIVTAALALRTVTARSAFGLAGTAAALAAGALLLVFGGSTAAWYSEMVAPALAAIGVDDGTRKVAGFADILNTQGVMGASGLLVVTWLLAVGVCGRRAGFYGRGPTVIAGVFTVIAAALYVLGRGAGAALTMMLPLAACGIWLLVASRRQVIRDAG